MDVKVVPWRRLSAEKLMPLTCGVGEDFKSPLDSKEMKPILKEINPEY